MPILEDLYNALLDHKNAKAERIANSLVLYVHGSQNYFNHRTNVDSKNRIMCFDIRDLGKQLKELGMLIVQDAVWNRVSQNRERKIATRYYCDEFHLLLKERQTAIYSVEIWKRFRKWGGIPTGLTQNVGDFLKSEEIEGILGNSDFVYLLNQNAKDQAILSTLRGIVFLLGFALVLPAILGMTGVWLSAPCSETLTAIIAVFLIRKQTGKRKCGELNG